MAWMTRLMGDPPLHDSGEEEMESTTTAAQSEQQCMK
jgi:hypothetical protein